MFNNLRKFLLGGVSHNKQSLNSCFYSLITAFVLVSGAVNIARADVCFLPDSADCAQGDTEGFWPCVGSDCDGGENGKCDASYNSRMSTNECGAACTRCADANSPYNGLYKCPENTCNCNDYTSTEAFNELIFPSMGRLIIRSHFLAVKLPMPFPSLPITKAQGRSKSTEE